jgi:quercetin dioxygenase-like cupin family protein
MAHAGEEIRGGGGFRLRFTRTAADTNGELLEMEATYGGTGEFPPEHLHPVQAEHFEVLEGSVRTIIGGSERVYGQGDAFDVPAGTPHQMTSDEPARMRWEVRPALRTEQFFEELYGVGGGGGVGVFLRRTSVLADFRDEFRLTKLPDPLQRVLFAAIAPFGRRLRTR